MDLASRTDGEPEVPYLPTYCRYSAYLPSAPDTIQESRSIQHEPHPQASVANCRSTVCGTTLGACSSATTSATPTWIEISSPRCPVTHLKSPSPSVSQHGSGACQRDDSRQGSQVRRCRLRQRCRHIAVPNMPEAGEELVLLWSRLLQEKLGRSVVLRMCTHRHVGGRQTARILRSSTRKSTSPALTRGRVNIRNSIKHKTVCSPKSFRQKSCPYQTQMDTSTLSLPILLLAV